MGGAVDYPTGRSSGGSGGSGGGANDYDVEAAGASVREGAEKRSAAPPPPPPPPAAKSAYDSRDSSSSSVESTADEDDQDDIVIEQTSPPSGGSGGGGTTTAATEEKKNGSLLPVLIFPGFMSSGLEVKRSSVSQDEWEGVRVWLNLERLGFKSLHTAGALRKEEKEGVVEEGGGGEKTKKQVGGGGEGEDEDGRKAKDGGGIYSALRQDRERALPCKSDWLQHVCLSSDLRTERPGMAVRPIEGLRGVDYLGQHERQFLVQKLINSTTYVFGPVIRALQKAGYEPGKDLDAAPYDWRVPPCVLEERDGYFTDTMRKVETLYEQNDGTPVVLLCHSMGCRMAHYFLNFARHHPTGGMEWLEKHIHTYMPVGAPSLGAPKSIRGIVDGDKMGLDAFLSDEEGLLLGRSLGSALFLLPHDLPVRNAPPNAVVRNEGALHVTVSEIRCRELLSLRDAENKEVPKIRLLIKFGEKSLNTKFQEPVGEDLSVHFRERFLFPAPPSLPLSAEGGSDAFQVVLLEPAIDRAAMSAKETFCDSWICVVPLCIVNLALVAIKFALFGTYLFFRRMFKGAPEQLLPSAQDISDVATDSATKVASTTLACSRKLNLTDVLAGRHEAQFTVELATGRGAFCYSKSRTASVDVTVHWANPLKKVLEMETCSPIAVPTKPGREMARHGLRDTTDGCPVTNLRKKNKHVQYEPISCDALLYGEGMSYVFDAMRDCYDADPLGPRTFSAKDPPPVKRVKAIYGVNLPTEVGAVYRRASLFLEDGKLQKLHELDVSAGLKMHRGEYEIRKGVIVETKNTPQVILGPTIAGNDAYRPSDGNSNTKAPRSALHLSKQGSGSIHKSVAEGELVHRSGDGTVPYWSLQHCRTWEGPDCDVCIDEIEGAEHREILANRTFHKILIEYVTQGSARVSVKSAPLLK